MSRKTSKKERDTLLMFDTVVLWKDVDNTDNAVICVTEDSSTVPESIDQQVLFYLTKHEFAECLLAVRHGRKYDCGDFYIISVDD